jgi:hypothetical protein
MHTTLSVEASQCIVWIQHASKGPKDFTGILYYLVLQLQYPCQSSVPHYPKVTSVDCWSHKYFFLVHSMILVLSRLTDRHSPEVSNFPLTLLHCSQYLWAPQEVSTRIHITGPPTFFRHEDPQDIFHKWGSLILLYSMQATQWFQLTSSGSWI